MPSPHYIYITWHCKFNAPSTHFTFIVCSCEAAYLMPLRGVGTWRRPLFYEGYGEFLTSATLQEPLRWTACNPKAYLENSCPAVMRTWWTCSSSEVVNAQSKPPTNDHTSPQIIYINEIIDAIRTCFDLSCHFIGAPASPAFSTPWVGCL